MNEQILSFNVSRLRYRTALFLFPALFIIALVFPPLLLLLPAVLFPILTLFREVPSQVLPTALFSAVRLPGRRSPPLAA